MKYFKTDGIRGILNKDFDLKFLERLGIAIGVLGENVIIGTDNRITSPKIKKALIKGMMKNGVRVIDAGVCTTPIISFLSRRYNMLGVIVTASHNPSIYNGVKVFKDGEKLEEEDELKIENNLNSDLKIIKGKYIKNFKLKKEYYKLINLSIPKTKKRIALDMANGPLGFNKIKGFKIIGNNKNGRFINETGVMNLKEIKKYIKRKKCDYGFAFDGDADRLYLITKNLNLLNGDYLVYLIAIYLKNKGLLKDNFVVLTKVANLGVLKALDEELINYTLVDIGDKNVRRCCKTLGGESSGHIINNLLFNKGDALLNALYIIKIVEKMKIDLDAFYEGIEKYYEYNINLEGSYEIPNLDRFNCYDNALIIVRPSGTERVIRIHVQSSDYSISKKIAKEVENFIKNNK